MERQSFMMTETEPGTHGEGPACFMQGREGLFAQQATMMPVTSPLYEHYTWGTLYRTSSERALASPFHREEAERRAQQGRLTSLSSTGLGRLGDPLPRWPSSGS